MNNSDSQPSIETQKQIDLLCDQFERNLREGRKVPIEEILNDVAPEVVPKLLRALLNVELEVARPANMESALQEHKSRFPEHTAVVESAFRDVEPEPTGSFNQPSAAEDVQSVGGVEAAEVAATIDPGNPNSGSTSAVKSGSRVRYFGDYEILEEIARGGMGVVYKARQVSLNRPVALKMILSAQFVSQESVQRFRAEAEAAAKLDHPGIVPIYEVGEHEGQYYFSMGLVEGGSLADLLDGGPIATRKAATVVREIAEAIQYAHSRNIVHRDLKPANVLLDEHGSTKVTDFGLAKNIEKDSGLTVSGQIMGTPGYMPPEQAAGKIDEIGPLADVYSLGAVLYYLLTERPPIQGSNVAETLRLVVEKEAPSPRSINKHVDLDLETICLKCLEKEPGRRYASAAELSGELGRYLNREPIMARPLGRAARCDRWCRRNPIVASLVALSVLLLVSGTAVATHFAVESSQRAEELEQSNEQLVDKQEKLNLTIAELETAKQQLMDDVRQLIIGTWNVHTELDEEKLKNMPEDRQITQNILKGMYGKTEGMKGEMELRSGGTMIFETSDEMPELGPLQFLEPKHSEGTWELLAREGNQVILRTTIEERLPGFTAVKEYTMTVRDRDTLQMQLDILKDMPFKPTIFTRKQPAPPTTRK